MLLDEVDHARKEPVEDVQFRGSCTSRLQYKQYKDSALHCFGMGCFSGFNGYPVFTEHHTGLFRLR